MNCTIVTTYTNYDEELYINGKLLKKITPIETVREGIQIIYQDFSLFPNLTVAENIVMSNSVNQNNRLINWKTINHQAKKVLEDLNKEMNLSAHVGTLAMAKQQIVAIARAIMQDAKVIIWMNQRLLALRCKENKGTV